MTRVGIEPGLPGHWRTNRVRIKESKKRDISQEHTRQLKKTMEHDGNGKSSFNLCTRNNLQKIGKGTGRLRNQCTKGNCPDCSIINIVHYTEKSPGDLSKLVVTQTPEDSQHLKLMCTRENMDVAKKRKL